MNTRREFLKKSSLLALAPTVPGFLCRTARAADASHDDRVLVVVQMSGGNDGINTVVPFADEGYAKHRDKLRIKEDRLLKLDKHIGLHPSMRAAADMIEDGRLAIVQGVGYPNPNRSHDVSMATWQSARTDREEHDSYGWLGRALDESAPAGAPASLLAGDDQTPLALRGRECISSSLHSLDELLAVQSLSVPTTALNSPDDSLSDFVQRQTVAAFSTADQLRELARRQDNRVSYPATRLAGRLKLIAQLIKTGLGTRVYYAIQPGYDTHSGQQQSHFRLLRELSGALKAFHDDLAMSQLDERVITMCFSEFGRRVGENASAGTDHGTAGPVLVAGQPVRSGLHGETPDLLDLADGDLRYTVDFRRVYAAMLG